jgi:hypothetical protein
MITRCARARASWLAPPCVALALSACTPGKVDVAPDAMSPQASAVPAPLANVPAVASALPLGPDAGPPPTPLRGDRALSSDSASKDKEVGYFLQAVLRAGDVPPTTRGPEVSMAGIDAARKKTEPRLAIDLTATRARITFSSHGFVLPIDTELRARSDRFGYIVLWPGGASYRTLSAGSLRSLLGERRFDVAPPSSVEVAAQGEGSRRLGLKTRKVEVKTRAATARVEIARAPDLGEGGVILGRVLLDLVSAPPSTPLCAWEEVPVHAELRWTTQGSITFDVLSLARRADMPTSQMLVPPPSAAYTAQPLAAPSDVFLAPQELAAFRSAPIDVPLAPTSPGQEPPTGLLLHNTTDGVRFVWLDGVPIAWLGPGERNQLTGIQRGRYQLQWRTFLGDVVDPPQVVTVPGKATAGAFDAGVVPGPQN